MVDLLALRVANRFLRESAAIGDPKDFLREFEAAVLKLTQPPSKVEAAKELFQKRLDVELAASREEWTAYIQSQTPAEKQAFKDASDVAYNCLFAVTQGSARIVEPGHKLFLAILQTYALPPALRKKVEIASRTYLKKTQSRPKVKGRSSGLEYIAFYEKFLLLINAHLTVAKEAVVKGKAHAEEGAGATKIKAGPFTLVNTGGFSEKQMGDVADVMHKVASLAQSSGLGAVCYGEVQVTNTISRANVLAFYLIANDEMFVRANVKATTDTVQTVLHELGHRYEKKFLTNSHGTPATLYRTLEGQEHERTWGPKKKVKMAEPGDTLEAKGKTYVVTRTVPGPGLKGYKVLLTIKDKPGSSATVPLDTFWEMKGEKARDIDADPEYIGFVSDYAKRGGPTENFAEMFSYYCMGRLPTLQSVPFEALVFGTGKTSHMRTVHRVAARFLFVRL
jgi:hypothetical protein